MQLPGMCTLLLWPELVAAAAPNAPPALMLVSGVAGAAAGAAAAVDASWLLSAWFLPAADAAAGAPAPAAAAVVTTPAATLFLALLLLPPLGFLLLSLSPSFLNKPGIRFTFWSLATELATLAESRARGVSASAAAVISQLPLIAAAAAAALAAASSWSLLRRISAAAARSASCTPPWAADTKHSKQKKWVGQPEVLARQMQLQVLCVVVAKQSAVRQGHHICWWLLGGPVCMPHTETQLFACIIFKYGRDTILHVQYKTEACCHLTPKEEAEQTHLSLPVSLLSQLPAFCILLCFDGCCCLCLAPCHLLLCLLLHVLLIALLGTCLFYLSASPEAVYSRRAYGFNSKLNEFTAEMIIMLDG
jgi:hypothetical protein